MQTNVRPATALGANRTVLVVVEEAKIRDLLAFNLLNAGFYPVQAASMEECLRLVMDVRPDVIVIDIDSPATVDLSFISKLGTDGDGNWVPVVLLSSQVPELCGQDGQNCHPAFSICKPYSPRELVEQVDHILRSGPKPKQKARASRRRHYRVGGLELDVVQRAASTQLGDEAKWVELSPRLTQLLRCLMESSDRVLTRDQIVDLAWAGEAAARTVDQSIKRLRHFMKKIGADDMLQTVWSSGYRLSASLPLNTVERGRVLSSAERRPPATGMEGDQALAPIASSGS